MKKKHSLLLIATHIERIADSYERIEALLEDIVDRLGDNFEEELQDTNDLAAALSSLEDEDSADSITIDNVEVEITQELIDGLRPALDEDTIANLQKALDDYNALKALATEEAQPEFVEEPVPSTAVIAIDEDSTQQFDDWGKK